MFLSRVGGGSIVSTIRVPGYGRTRQMASFSEHCRHGAGSNGNDLPPRSYNVPVSSGQSSPTAQNRRGTITF
jgi:hypothetical protein